MLLLLPINLKGSRNIHGFALIRAVLFVFEFLRGLKPYIIYFENLKLRFFQKKTSKSQFFCFPALIDSFLADFWLCSEFQTEFKKLPIINSI